MKSLASCHVVIVGGSSGMGFAIAAAAIEEGAQVTIGSANAARLEAATKRLGASAKGRAIDLASLDSIEEFITGLQTIDHLVVAAQSSLTLATITPLTGLDFAAVEAVFRVKLFGTLHMVRLALSRMVLDGSIILFSGAASRRIIAGHVTLGALNAAVEGAGRQLAKELAPIRVNVISPGLVQTEAYDAMPGSEEMFASRAKALPVGRVGMPEDIALAAVHLMRNGYVTGVVQDIDGGGLLA